MADPRKDEQEAEARAARTPPVAHTPAHTPAARAAPAPEADASLYLHPQTLAKLGSFELRAKLIVEGVSSGLHRSPFQGFSVEFAQHRPYVAGDDIRHLDWKVYGRSDKLHLKQYQQETNLDLVTLVDASGSMLYGSRSFEEASGAGHTLSPDGRAHWSKFDHATALAAAISYVTLKQGDRVGLVVYSDKVRAMVRRSSSQGTWRQIVGALATHPVDDDNKKKPTDFPRAVEQFLASVTNKCIVAIVSDFFSPLDEIKLALSRLKHAGHDVIAFQILDRMETRFDFTDAAPFAGMEGEPMLRVDPRALRKAYLEAINRHLIAVEKLVLSLGYDYQRLGTHDWLGPPLAAFVARRNTMIKRSKFG